MKAAARSRPDLCLSGINGVNIHSILRALSETANISLDDHQREDDSELRDNRTRVTWNGDTRKEVLGSGPSFYADTNECESNPRVARACRRSSSLEICGLNNMYGDEGSATSIQPPGVYDGEDYPVSEGRKGRRSSLLGKVLSIKVKRESINEDPCLNNNEEGMGEAANKKHPKNASSKFVVREVQFDSSDARPVPPSSTTNQSQDGKCRESMLKPKKSGLASSIARPKYIPPRNEEAEGQDSANRSSTAIAKGRARKGGLSSSLMEMVHSLNFPVTVATKRPDQTRSQAQSRKRLPGPKDVPPHLNGSEEVEGQDAVRRSNATTEKGRSRKGGLSSSLIAMVDSLNGFSAMIGHSAAADAGTNKNVKTKRGKTSGSQTHQRHAEKAGNPGACSSKNFDKVAAQKFTKRGSLITHKTVSASSFGSDSGHRVECSGAFPESRDSPTEVNGQKRYDAYKIPSD